MASRTARWLDRVVLGAGMSLVAYLMERRLVRAMKRRERPAAQPPVT